MEIITIQSTDVPYLPNLEAIDSEALLTKILQQLSDNKYRHIDTRPGQPGPIEGYKTPLRNSEIIVHIYLSKGSCPVKSDINVLLHEYIVSNKLSIVQAVRHTYGEYTRIVAVID